jgi:WD40 repeat protein
LWQTKDGARIKNIAGAGIPLAFSDDGSLLAAQTNKNIQIWRVADGTLLQSMPYNGWINKVVFSPNSQVIAAAINTNIFIWNVTDGKLLNVLPGELDTQVYSNSVVFSPDGKLLAYDSYQTIEIWGTGEDSLEWSNNH